jgi:hypothetical protein
MINTSVPISILLDGVRQAYIDDQKKKGIRSSGKSADSLRIATTETSGTLFGAGYWFQQKHGRKPGKFPPISAIIDWIRNKAIQATDIPERSLAFIIARKIAEKGTDIYQGRREGVNVEDRIKELVKEFRDNLAKNVKGEIIKALK